MPYNETPSTMSPEVAEMLSKPLDPKNMSDDGAMRLIEHIIRGIRHDYIGGKLEMLRRFHEDLSEDEFYAKANANSIGFHSYHKIELYFLARRDLLDGWYGINNIVPITDVLNSWDAEAYAYISRRRRRLIDGSSTND